MFASRTAVRSARIVRANGQTVRRNVRFASDSASSGSSAGALSHPAVMGALGGAGAGTLLFYAWYQYTGMGKVARTAKQTKQYIDGATEQLKIQFKEKTPDTNEVIQTLKETAYKYAKWLPGGREYVDKAFKDLDTVRSKHGEEVDRIAKEAYGELRDASKNGLSLQTVTQIWEITSEKLQQLGSLASDASQDILNNHPELKDCFGGSFQQLQQLGDQLGPEAKKQVDETWSEIRRIFNQGLGWESVQKVQKLVEDKKEQVRKLSSQAWEKGYEQIKPTLERNPQVKQLVENNYDLLRSGNVSDVLSKISYALSSGSTLDLEKYIVQAKEKAQNDFAGSGGLTQWLTTQIPQGGKIIPQLQKLKQAADTRGDEAKQLAKETFNDIAQVLEKRGQQLDSVLQNAKKDAK
ncbi:hypothetical protein EJ03DRAFT_329425 [Teratosphaeria nubilosa]|uniref:Uncharacterized protein n=1 Tax=Teratosphaeria nubilosa TaxID=161662 RepID=A0A6G1L367_9PEZI|nr:hypothetical protein EJ03DRAFT_329425 [Teratosphaeria nubilosa]